jgi:hypothetical protein
LLYHVINPFLITKSNLMSDDEGERIHLACEGAGSTAFSLRTRLAYFTNCKDVFQEAYERVSGAASRIRVLIFDTDSVQ